MVKIYREKIKTILKSLSGFFKRYLPEIVFLVFVFQLLISLNALPYFNIINQYYYYVTALLWVILNILFKEYITNKKILQMGIMSFIFAIPFVIFGLTPISEAFGFFAFLLLFTYVVREIVTSRDLFKN